MTQTLSPPTRGPSASGGRDDERVASRVFLSGISWELYNAILQGVDEASTRLTYDSGSLEIEMPSRRHEQVKKFMAALVETSLRHAAIDYEPSGSTTWKREDLQRGLEADECYHIQHLAQVVGKVELDLAIDPPPDLAIEIDLSPRRLDKVSIYQSLGVPEIWRVRAGAHVEISVRAEDGRYEFVAASPSVPPLTAEIVSRYLTLRDELGHAPALRRFETEVLGK